METLHGKLRWVGHALCLLGLVYFGMFFWKESAHGSKGSLHVVLQAFGTPEVLSACLLALIFFVLALSLNSIAWTLIIRALGEGESAFKLIQIYLRTLMAKYVPGNIAHLISRVAYGSEQGIPKLVLGGSLVVELFLGTAAGALLGLSVAWYRPAFANSFNTAILEGSIWRITFISVAVLLAGTVLFLGWFYLLRKKSDYSKFLDQANLLKARLGPLCMFSLLNLAVYLLAFLFLGYGLALIIRALEPDLVITVGTVWLITAVHALSVVIGLITPGAPAGLGVKEAFLVVTLGQFLDNSVAIQITVISRVLSVWTDGIGFFLSIILPCQRMRKPS